MVIRRCNIEEIEKVSKFYDDVIIYLDNHINYPKWKYKIYPSILSVTAMTKKGEQFICLDEDDNIIGSFVFNNDPEGDYHKAKWGKDIEKFMVIHSFAINPNNHRSGLGSKMINYCITKAKELGMDGIRLDAVPTNVPARRFYEKNGFKYVTDMDLGRNIEDIPLFSLYELYFN